MVSERLTDKQIEELTRELVRQWYSNHQEHCSGVWPHTLGGVWPHMFGNTLDCYWPLPECLKHLSESQLQEYLK